MKFDLDILNSYLEKGLLEKNDHPNLPLSIWNYSRTCQYSGSWDEITLKCRGLILDNEGNVVARAFDKFFNYEEVVDQVPVRGDYVYVQEKLDGSLGILFHYADDWHMATKGSFTSDQAKRGMEIIKSKYQMRTFLPQMTYLCEIIYPENRIVVDYRGKEKVVFIGVTSEGEELHWTMAQSIFIATGIEKKDRVETEQHFSFGPELYRSLKEKQEGNREGYVLRFQPGNFRMKIKFEEYVRLHRILTGFSNKDIWEYLKDKRDFNKLLDRVPDEFDSWVRETAEDLNTKYESIQRDYVSHFLKIREKTPDRKSFAEEAKKFPHSGILFAMLDGREYDEHIWKIIKPDYQKPFWKRED
jgi:RNA ligase